MKKQSGKIEDTNELLKKYGKLKTKGGGKLLDMCGDLFHIGMKGECVRVTHGTVWEMKKGNKIWFELEIKDSVLIYEGIKKLANQNSFLTKEAK